MPLVALAAAACMTAAFAPPASAARKVVRRVGADFAVVIAPDSLRVTAGQRAVFPVSVLSYRGFHSVPRFEIDGVPDYIDAEIVTLSRSRYQLELIVPANAPSTNAVYQLIGTSGGRSRVALFRLDVVGGAPVQTNPPVTIAPVTIATLPPITQPPVTVPPQFGLRADTSERSAATGETVTYGLTVDRSSGYAGPVAFDVGSTPADLRLNFAPNPTTSSTNLYVTPGPSTPSGRYILAIVASAGGSQRTVAVAITVTAASDFALLATPSTATITGVGSATYRVDIAASNNLRPAVAFEVSGLPIGATARFSSPTADKSTNLVVTTTSGVTPGTYPLTITGRSGPYVRQTQVQLVIKTVAPGFGLSAAPNVVLLPRAGTSFVTVTVSPFGGFTGTVTVSASNLPNGVTIVPTANSSNVATLAFRADNTAVLGATTINIVGTSGTYSAQVQVVLSVI